MMIRWFCLRYLPLYIRFWPTYHWLALWSAPRLDVGQAHWGSLRITLRYGKHHSRIMNVIKRGTV